MKNATIIAMTFATLLTTSMMSGNAAATVCNSHYVTATGSSAGAIAKFRKRRAERRAKRAWENDVAHKYGKKYADFDEAYNRSIKFGVTSRGNTAATVSGMVTVCH